MVNITARGFELTNGPKEGIQKELKRVEKMLPDTASFDVTLSKTNAGYKCDVTVKHTGSFIRGEAAAEKIDQSIDFAVDDLKRKLRKLKTSLVDKKRKSGIDALASAMQELSDVESSSGELVSTEIKRTKLVSLHVMSDEEAIVQMEMLGHSFFVYLGEDGQTRVIYVRKKGYGMLVCD